MAIMYTRRYSTSELATHAGLPVPTVKHLMKQGVLQASVQRAEGRGHGCVFNYQDVLTAMSLGGLRLPNASAEPFRRLAEFWHSPEGTTLVQSVLAALRAERKRPRQGEQRPEPRVLLVTDKGVAFDTTPADLMKKDKTTAVYCVDAKHFVDRLNIGSTEAHVGGEFPEPGPNGRVPRREKGKKTRASRRNARREDVGRKATTETKRRSAP